MHALRIDPDTTVTDLNLPATDAQSAIQEHVGSDAIDQGVYHRRALLHIHGNGLKAGLPQKGVALLQGSPELGERWLMVWAG
jgi:hypothetical protein